MNKSIVVILIVAVLAVAGGAFVLTKKPANTQKTDTTASQSAPATQSPSPQATTSTTQNQPAESATITYNSNGFSPASLTVKAGTTVTIKNDSSSLLQFDSNPHPQHTDDPDLNVGSVSPGQSKTFTVTQTGTHGYHNHLKSGDTGTIIVE